MLKHLIRLFAPRTGSQFLWGFAFWMTAFQLVFFGALSLFGLLGAAPLPHWIAIGAICISPFLSLTLGMLRYQIKLQRQMLRTARTDQLTRLANRRDFLSTIRAELPHRSGVIMMIDIDHFKSINDTYGHGFGDLCLKEMANLMKPLMPGAYHLARLGGEEFGIMLFDGTMRQAETIGRRIVGGISIANPVDDRYMRITNSIGMTFSRPGENLSDLLSRADRALYQAKADGRARMVFWETLPEAAPAQADLPQRMAS